MIKFHTIRWKNFLAAGNTWTEIQLDKQPNTLIVGKNGAGKSTLLDALTFVLFGKPFRKINKPQIVNTVNESDCLVEVEFTIGTKKYLVRRGLKPAIFDIEVDGLLLDKMAHAKDSQEYLETQILKLNYKSFTQVVVLGSSTFIPFMQLTAAARREVIEDLLGIEVFSAMNTILKRRISKVKDAMKDNATEIALKEQMVEVQSKNLERIATDNQRSAENTEERISKLREENAGLLTSNQDLMTNVLKPLIIQRKDSKTLQGKLNELNTLNTRLESKKEDLERDIKFYEDQDSCGTCGQDIEDDFKSKIVVTKTSEIEEIDSAIGKLSHKIADAKTEISTNNQLGNEIDKHQTDVNNNNLQIATNNQIIETLTQTLGDITQKEDTSVVEQEISEAKTTLKDLHDNQDKYTKESRLNKLAYALLKDTGIKTVIVKQYLPIMNKLINQYLAKMDFFINFNLDENFSETIKSRHRDVFSYESFSEGEKMRIDLALLFTWRMIARLKNSTNTNLLILDEVFDSSLDDLGTEEFLKILYELGKEQNVFVISHKTDVFHDKFNNVIKFEKRKNFNRIV